MTRLVFCDFDGTISPRDIGYNLFNHFTDGRNEELIPDWISGALSTRDCLEAEAAMVRAEPNEIYSFLDRFDIDPGFVDFLSLCRKNDAPITVLSDGLDFYIDYVLKRHGLDHLEVIANVGRLENGTITVDFPYTNSSCKRCGSCKAERINERRAQADGETQTIFVGDGYSDTCAIEAADILFANKDLEKHCIKNNIEYYGFDSFADVSRKIIDLSIMSA